MFASDPCCTGTDSPSSLQLRSPSPAVHHHNAHSRGKLLCPPLHQSTSNIGCSRQQLARSCRLALQMSGPHRTFWAPKLVKRRRHSCTPSRTCCRCVLPQRSAFCVCDNCAPASNNSKSKASHNSYNLTCMQPLFKSPCHNSLPSLTQQDDVSTVQHGLLQAQCCRYSCKYLAVILRKPQENRTCVGHRRYNTEVLLEVFAESSLAMLAPKCDMQPSLFWANSVHTRLQPLCIGHTAAPLQHTTDHATQCPARTVLHTHTCPHTCLSP